MLRMSASKLAVPCAVFSDARVAASWRVCAHPITFSLFRLTLSSSIPDMSKVCMP